MNRKAVGLLAAMMAVSVFATACNSNNESNNGKTGTNTENSGNQADDNASIQFPLKEKTTLKVVARKLRWRQAIITK